MRILMYEWESYLQYDVKSICRESGIELEPLVWEFLDKNRDDAFEAWFCKSVDSKKYDALLSMNYWPVLSRAAQKCGIKYLAWCYDNPIHGIHPEETLENPVNFVFVFDRVQAGQYRQMGIDTVYELPLGVNAARLEKLQISELDRKRYLADVSLVGTLYEPQVQKLKSVIDDRTRGYLNGAIAAQQELYGAYLLDDLVTEELVAGINQYAAETFPDKTFVLSKEELVFNMACEVTRNERLRLLTQLGKRCDTRLYSPQIGEISQEIKWFPPVDYVTEMPKVFACSKINLNSTLKCIQSGIPLRALDIMGAGGFLLSNYQAELAEQFTDGQDMVLYESTEDAAAKADYYLKHEQRRREIAENGKNRVLREYSLKARLEDILRISGVLETAQRFSAGAELGKKAIRYYVISPAGGQSGGSELTHQLCSELIGQNKDAKMYYIYSDCAEPVNVEAMPRYLKYGTDHAKDMEEANSDKAVVIFNESSTSYIPFFKRARKLLWWMSVDNYLVDAYRIPEEVLKEQIDLHLVQSFYAYNYVKNAIGVPEENIIFLSDYTHENFKKRYFPEGFRQNIVLYNPKKGYERLASLIEMTPEVKWIPLINLNEEQLMKIMQIAKVYIDLGNHPGKDRIPREAAVSGCCILTNKAGSAAFYEDVPICEQYKFEHCEEEYDKMRKLILDICSHFEEHSQRFEQYRQWILEEKMRFKQDAARMARICEARF